MTRSGPRPAGARTGAVRGTRTAGRLVGAGEPAHLVGEQAEAVVGVVEGGRLHQAERQGGGHGEGHLPRSVA
ncbi:hypothetical protein LV779_24855 [Streptomyces thinghirensis]|nr:hypothetical protein [Streptomyces thinghirensis]